MSVPTLQVQKGEKTRFRLTPPVLIALSYAIFLLVCLALVLFICIGNSNNGREAFWHQQATQLEADIATMSSYKKAIENYADQMLTDSTFVRLAHLDTSDMNKLVDAAHQVMKNMTIRSFSLLHLPVKDCNFYLETSGYIVSSTHFVEMERFYRANRGYDISHYDEWLDVLTNATAEGRCVNASAFTRLPYSTFFITRLNPYIATPQPVVVWFELDVSAIRRLFLPENVSEARALILDDHGEIQLSSTFSAMDIPSHFSSDGMADLDGMRYIQRSDQTGWRYILALPHSMCEEALGSLNLLAGLIFALSLLVGAVVVFLLIRGALRPFRQLSRQLSQAQDDNADLMRQIDAQRPALENSYLRTLLSGHVSTQEEFSYMMRYLGLEGEHRYFVLFCIAHHQQETIPEAGVDEHDLIVEHIEEYLTDRYPIYHYITLDSRFVILTTYDADQPEPLMDLQHRVLDLHNDLAANHALWFYAGVGGSCTQPQQLWESYEQARTAVRYTAKQHIFLPYEFIRKDTDNWYYPIEISTKLQHFITTCNRQQVTEMFALIYRENIQERRLTVPLLNLLLSDLRNTLFKTRFQIPTPQTGEGRAALAQLDERLHAAPDFPQLEANALAMCDFFLRTVEPSDPIPEIELYLQENFTDPSLCLSKLSERFTISESYLSHLFKNRTGQNFSVYLEKLRVNEAARRLKDKDCNLSALYSDLGYTNPTTFRRAFKKHFSLTPSEMRQQLQGQL